MTDAHTVVTVSKKDLQRAGFLVSGVTPMTIARIAEAMGQKYLQTHYWQHLTEVAQDLGVQPLNSPDKILMSQGLSNRGLLLSMGYDTHAVDYVNWENLYQQARATGYVYYENIGLWFKQDGLTERQIEILHEIDQKAKHKDEPKTDNK